MVRIRVSYEKTEELERVALALGMPPERIRLAQRTGKYRRAYIILQDLPDLPEELEEAIRNPDL